MKRLSLLIVLLALSFSLLIVTATTLSKTLSSKPASFATAFRHDLLLANGTWCLRGLCLGKTRDTQVFTSINHSAGSYNIFDGYPQLARQPYLNLTVKLRYSEDSAIHIITLIASEAEEYTLPSVVIPNLTAVDVIEVFGNPTRIAIERYGQRRYLSLCYLDGLCFALSSAQDRPLTPQDRIIKILITTPFELRLMPPLGGYEWKFVQWRGFAHYDISPFQ